MDIIEQTREIGKEIQKDERYLKMQIAIQNADADKELQDLIGQYNLKRMSLQNEMQLQNRDENKVKAYRMAMDSLYGSIMKNNNMIEYNSAKEDLEKLMRRVNAILEQSVNGGDPETADYDEHACGGNCAACGGCH
jgi:cell fate (sporulation/competence/biofilm development) regulator YlbF (YheA/YmcA/DUF963 family)